MNTLIQEHSALSKQIEEIENKLYEFAKIQLQLMREASVVAGFSHKMDSSGSYRFLQYTDWMDVGEGGSITCWERGCWGGSDEISGGFTLDPLILEGKNDEYKAKQIEFFKEKLKTIEAKKIQDAKRDVEEARAALARQQEELNRKLAALEAKQ